MTTARADAGTVADSMVLAGCTAVSRATGVVRVVMVAAVLGPTHFGNTFGLTNQFPNLVFYGFLAGSLFCSLLVPALVRHIDSHDTGRTVAVAGGFLGVTWSVMAVVAPVAVVLLPLALSLSTAGAPGGAAQTEYVWVLVCLTVPQIFLYTVATCSSAVLNAHRRFALAAVAPAVENLGVIAMLGLVAVWYDDLGSSGSPPLSAVIVLGLGSTMAVAAHAAFQWWGVSRCGIRLRPRWGWRDPEVMVVVHRAVRSLGQAGLQALQTLTLLLLASRVAGGTVALQVALNFYYLPIALVATPVGLSLLPRLARLEQSERSAESTDAFLGGLSLALFLTVPAAVGYVLLAGPLAGLVLTGAMDTDSGTTMVTWTLMALAFGLAGQTVFFVGTQAAYARGEPRLPLRWMAVQASVCLLLSVTSAVMSSGARLVVLLGASYAAASLMGGGLLLRSLVRGRSSNVRRLAVSLAQVGAGAVSMAVPVLSVLHVSDLHDAGRPFIAGVLVLTALLGSLVYLGVEAVVGSADARLLFDVVRRRRRDVAAAGQDAPA